LLTTLKGVRAVESVPASEAGADLASFQIDAERDLREEICRTLVLGNLGVVEITRGERELESIFLRLASPEPAKGAAAALAKEAS
jgi:ABC-2 type transport system ATP-binding protein